MTRRYLIAMAGILPLVSCGQAANKVEGNITSTSAVAPPKKHAYCFFKDGELKDWKISRDTHGNLTVDGEGHVNDPRYKASFGSVSVGPKKAILEPTISQNDLGYAMRDNWWHLGMVVPKSDSIDEAIVQCGDKVVADLKVPPRG